MPMQAGDVPATWADTALLEMLTGYVPTTDIGNVACKILLLGTATIISV